MSTNQERVYVGMTERECCDYDAGWNRGYDTPYYPQVHEEIILANIAKVSPAFVAGYKAGKGRACYEEAKVQAEQDAIDLDEFFRDLDEQ